MPEVVQRISEAICRPEGTVEFEYSSDAAFKQGSDAGVILEVPAGGHLFRLERTSDRVLRFYHSSPGTGTRVAEIALSGLPDFEQVYLALTWTPEETNFYCGPRIPGAGLLSARGELSDVQFRVARDGSVFQVGGPGAEVMAVRVREAGRSVLTPTAIETWTSTLKAIEVLWTGQSDQGFMFEVVLSNVTLSILVTGLETYAKTRLLEIESEGMDADWAETFGAFASRKERESERLRELHDRAGADGISVLEAVVNTGRINFQKYEHLKRAYKAAYGVKVGELAIGARTPELLQGFIRHRHRVVHVSPLLGMLNEEAVPREEPVFANRTTADRAVACFSEFVKALHDATLKLRSPTDSPNNSGSSPNRLADHASE
jgi:hypothetical protein